MTILKSAGGPKKGGKSTAHREKQMVKGKGDWRESTLSLLRSIIMTTDVSIIDKVKWRKPSNPDGVPVWSHSGILCVGNILKEAVRLTFPHGAQIRDPEKLFNTRLNSKTVRAIDFREGEPVKESALRAILLEAVDLNKSKARGK